jgi:hypothetical protein
MKQKYYRVTTWRNGITQNNNATYGIRISKRDYEELKKWEEIKVGNTSILRASVTFTEKCPEVRSQIIKEFLKSNNLLEWEKFKPHELYLLEHQKNKFQLLLKEPQ